MRGINSTQASSTALNLCLVLESGAEHRGRNYPTLNWALGEPGNSCAYPPSPRLYLKVWWQHGVNTGGMPYYQPRTHCQRCVNVCLSTYRSCRLWRGVPVQAEGDLELERWFPVVWLVSAIPVARHSSHGKGRGDLDLDRLPAMASW
jgi:hypothetical protein